MVKVKCLKARNEYLLCVQAANAALHKYFADDLSDVIDVSFEAFALFCYSAFCTLSMGWRQVTLF